MHPATSFAAFLAVVCAISGAAAAQATTYEHTVYLHEYTGGLHILPEQINARVGDTLVLTVVNQGASPHNLRVCGDTPPSPSSECRESWGQTRFNIAANESATLTVEVKEAGTFEYYCYVPGHKSGGMVGTLVVQGGEPERRGLPAGGLALSATGLALAGWLARRAPP